ncbi:MAG: Fur family ferric uptake transcriptional regulator [Patescibacteria group bacterium]|jgi:Fur family ferric uptake transcriptional regulator
MAKPTRNTRQKEILEKSTSLQKGFFTAQDLLTKAQQKDSKIGIATIYRHLKTQAMTNKLHAYTCKNQTLYSTNQLSHSHFTCEKCKTTKHLKIDNIDFIKNNLEDQICHFQIDLTGTCEKCLKERR